MGFVGNYAPHGLSPQMYDMPVIPNNREADASRKKTRPTPKGHRLRWPYLRRSRGRDAPASIKPLHGGVWGGKPRLAGGVLGWSKRCNTPNEKRPRTSEEARGRRCIDEESYPIT